MPDSLQERLEPDLYPAGSHRRMLITHADRLAWDHGLRGYDAVHLAAADLWQDALGEEVTLAVALTPGLARRP